jgi:hypothetical protein
MPKKANVLGADVHVHGENGEVTIYEAGMTRDEVGKDAEKITNESAWVEVEQEEEAPKRGRTR